MQTGKPGKMGEHFPVKKKPWCFEEYIGRSHNILKKSGNFRQFLFLFFLWFKFKNSFGFYFFLVFCEPHTHLGNLAVGKNGNHYHRKLLVFFLTGFLRGSFTLHLFKRWSVSGLSDSLRLVPRSLGWLSLIPDGGIQATHPDGWIIQPAPQHLVLLPHLDHLLKAWKLSGISWEKRRNTQN